MTIRNMRRLGNGSVLAMVIGIMLFAVTPLALARELDAKQKQLLADATSHQTRFETNMKLALDSAGPGEGMPPASKAKLAMSRLQAAMQSVPTLEARFKELPADDEGVKTLKARFDAALANGQKLEARLTTAAPPAPANQEKPQQPAAAGQPGAPAAPAGAKLDYRQVEALKGAQFNLDQVDGYANALDEIVDKYSKTADKKSIDFREVGRGMNSIAEGKRKLGFANAALVQLPADGRGVAEALEQYKSLIARIEAAEKALVPLNTELRGAIDINNYPDFAADRTRLGELAQMFNPSVLQSRQAEAVDVIKTADAAKAERDRIMTKYADFLKQETELGKQIAGSANHFDSNYKQFADAAGKWAQSAPQQIDDDLKKVSEMAATAVADQKPAWFNGGIPQHLAMVEAKVTLFATIDPAAAKPSVEKLEALRGELKQQQAKLSEGIIAANDLPPDRYRGDDRAALEAMAVESWKTAQPDAQVLKVCIIGEKWERETKWQWSNSAWYKIDRSKLQAQLVVAQDDRLAVVRPVNLWIDHVNNDKQTATNLDDIKDEMEPQRFLLREKVR